MDIIILTQRYLFLALSLVALGIQIWALVDCVKAKPVEFQRAFKKTKGFWLGITAGSTAIGYICVPPPVGLGGPIFLQLIAVTAAAIYLADVRPALRDARRGGNRNSGPYGPW
ncbi:DUF2516 family protein [Arthrobacter castelli]|uniref:DUF2516 family protein n=1 Tax=Arthrobacter castelli TaxID=271431 RepID=UPI000405C1A1|nr:DUF2516 family protein [Arthrobacter castelli]